jgi:hypothetical protein
MEEQINKKSVFFVFIGLILLFLFIYKGVILSGEEYYEEYVNFRNQAEKQTVLKGKRSKSDNLEINDNDEKTEYIVLLNIVSQLENVKLELNSLDHSLKSKRQSINEKLEQIKNESNSHVVQSIIETVENANNQNGLENIIDVLNVNIKVLRKYINES